MSEEKSIYDRLLDNLFIFQYASSACVFSLSSRRYIIMFIIFLLTKEIILVIIIMKLLSLSVLTNSITLLQETYTQ